MWPHYFITLCENEKKIIMTKTFQILFFAVFIMNIENSVQYNLKTKTLEERIGNRFEFHLFENMYGSNIVYRKETNLIRG